MDVVGRVNPHSELQDHTVHVLDWKTGKYNVNQDQLKLYNLGVFLNWQRTMNVTSALVFVDHKKSSPPVASNRTNDMADLLDEFSDRSEAIQIAAERDSWPAQRNEKCRYCQIMSCKHKGF